MLTTGVIGKAAGLTDTAVRSQLVISLVFAHLALAYVARGQRRAFEPGWSRNRFLLAATGGSIILQVLAGTTPIGRHLLDLDALPVWSWVLAPAAALIVVGALDAVSAATRRWATRTRS